ILESGLESVLRPLPFEQIAWALPRELGDYDFLAANRRLVAELATGRIKPAEILSSSAPDAAPASHLRTGNFACQRACGHRRSVLFLSFEDLCLKSPDEYHAAKRPGEATSISPA